MSSSIFSKSAFGRKSPFLSPYFSAVARIWEMCIRDSYNPNVGSAMSLVLMVIILIIMGIINHFDDEEMEGMLV